MPLIIHRGGVKTVKLRELLQHDPFTTAVNRSIEPAILVLNLGSGYWVYQVYQVAGKPPDLAEVYNSYDLGGVETYLQRLQLDLDAWVSTG